MAKKEPEEWITVHGVHIPVYKGENRKQAVSNALNASRKGKEGAPGQKVHTATYKAAKFDKTNALNKTKTKTEVTELPKKSKPVAAANTNTTKASAGDVNTQMKELQKGGNVDLFKRPQVPASKLKEAGWKNAGDGTATVFTNTFTNQKGDKAGNFTPIMVKDDGSYEILTEKDLTEYAEAVMEGEIDDYLKLKIGETVEGENAADKAVEVADKIHELQDEYYLKRRK